VAKQTRLQTKDLHVNLMRPIVPALLLAFAVVLTSLAVARGAEAKRTQRCGDVGI
jgi:hypothetical protein